MVATFRPTPQTEATPDVRDAYRADVAEATYGYVRDAYGLISGETHAATNPYVGLGYSTTGERFILHTGPVIDLDQELRDLAERWRRETRHFSATDEIAMHPAYQQIIGFGKIALPFILSDLQRSLDHWFWALTMIVGEQNSPVRPHEAGKMRLMRDRWLQWGRDNKYIA